MGVSPKLSNMPACFVVAATEDILLILNLFVMNATTEQSNTQAITPETIINNLIEADSVDNLQQKLRELMDFYFYNSDDVVLQTKQAYYDAFTTVNTLLIEVKQLTL